MPIRPFLQSDRGTVSIDWVVLTALMLGTALAMTSTLRDGLEAGGAEEVAALRGLVIQRGFEATSCPGGADAVQAREAARIAVGGDDPVDVAGWLRIAAYRTDADLLDEHEALRSAVATRATTAWTRDRTLLATASCALVIRGLSPG